MERKISDIMTVNVYKLSPGDTIMQAAKIMKENDFGFIPVTENNKVLGVVTDRDLAIRGYAEGLPADTHLKYVMTGNCVTVGKDISISQAADIMAQNQIRRLCVMDGENIVGVCSLGDIALSRLPTANDALGEISRQYN